MPETTTKVILGVTRRAMIRYVWRLDAVGRVFVSQMEKSLVAEVVDLSRSGFGLQVAEPIEPGIVVSVEVDDRVRGTAQLQGEVANCHPWGDGWRCGCKLLMILK